ncbi:hypothetical protein PSAL_011880 [Pseudooceanicola algae]|uniref:DUF6314 domain-containing protein n=2 Tax=Pseudooceanicola algae TaxID=1537215 RepID=A0A418SCA6_9RHOB|nr:hypothetical protein PSAL_011880 [Pseudooceanicola algae]
MRDLGSFEGDWRIERRVANALGEDARLEGLARFCPLDTPSGGGALEVTETGTMQLAGQSFAAERRYLWRTVGARIAVDFDDGRFFHDFAPGEISPEARHDCAPDLYLVTYDFSRWPDWTAHWRVTGPRKDYGMQTRYTRA